MKVETITPFELNDLSEAQKSLGDAIKFPVNDLLTLSETWYLFSFRCTGNRHIVIGSMSLSDGVSVDSSYP